MKGVRKDERGTDQRYRQDERIRRYPAGTAGANRPASGRQNPPVGDSYIGGRPRRERISRRKPGIGDGAPEARTSAARKSADRTAQEVQNTGKKADRSQRSKKAGNSGSGEHRNRSGKGVSFLALLLVLILGAAPVWAEAITSGDGSGLIPWI